MKCLYKTNYADNEWDELASGLDVINSGDLVPLQRQLHTSNKPGNCSKGPDM